MVDTTNPTCALGSCVVAQFFFDGGGDTVTAPATCPPPYTTTAPGLAACTSATPPTDCGASGAVGVFPATRCRHVGNNGGADSATNGLGGSIYNPGTKKFLQGVPQIGPNPNDGEVTEIDPVTMLVTNHFRLTAATGAPGCQVASLAIGASNNLLVGCANREGEAFAASTFIMDVSAAGKGKIIKAIYNTGRADQVYYNPGDKRFYLASRDMENGSYLGIIDATTNMWLYNSPTGGNAHGVAVDPVNNHIYVPIAPNARCGRFSAEGCITVYAAQ
jgi:DNA-binding beta-propeller fold protein YncE